MRPVLPARARTRPPLAVRLTARLVGALAASALVVGGMTAPSLAADPRPNPPTPGHFTGHGFDQCLTPNQQTMDTWLARSPYLAVGIYISGDSRACRSQPNLTPRWVRTQLGRGWRLLPITLGPQASCQPRFPRYRDDFTIDPARGRRGLYPKARRMGKDSAAQTLADARRLGLVRGSTLFYDLEGFDVTNVACRESALRFLSAWNTVVEAAGYISGVYSSAGSGIKALDDARVDRPTVFNLPGQIWIARWDGVADTSTEYIRSDGWRPGGRLKQYRGGHDETWGGVRINVDTNYLDLGRGSVAAPEPHCGGRRVSFPTYATIKPRTGYHPPAGQVKALKCLLGERGFFKGRMDRTYGAGLRAAVRAWKTAKSQVVNGEWYLRDWMMLVSIGDRRVQKPGSAGGYTRRVQRAVNAADRGPKAPATGTYDDRTVRAVTAYQRAVGLPATGIVDDPTWTALQAGLRGPG